MTQAPVVFLLEILRGICLYSGLGSRPVPKCRESPEEEGVLHPSSVIRPALSQHMPAPCLFGSVCYIPTGDCKNKRHMKFGNGIFKEVLNLAQNFGIDIFSVPLNVWNEYQMISLLILIRQNWPWQWLCAVRQQALFLSQCCPRQLQLCGVTRTHWVDTKY